MEKLKAIFADRKKVIAIVVVLLALSLPFVVAQVLKEQDIRQKAQTVQPIQISFMPSTGSIVKDSTITVDLVVNTGAHDIGSLSFSMNYNNDYFQILDESAAVAPMQEILKTATNSKFSTVLINFGQSKVTGPGVKVYSFKLKTLRTGTTTLSLDPLILATGTGLSTYIPVENNSNIQATYTITEGTSTTLTPSPTTGTNTTPTPSSTPTPTTVSGATPTPTNTPAPTSSPTPTRLPTPTSTPIPTATLAPTATPVPGDLYVNFRAQLPGIGNGPVNLGLNPTPLKPQRNATVQILNSNGESITTVNGILTYNSNTSSFEGSIRLGTLGVLQPGSYNAKLKFANTLYRTIPGQIQITTGSNVPQAQQVSLVSGDLNNDNTLGVFDWTYMIACIKNEASCTQQIRSLADLNDNGVIDETDVQILQRGFAVRQGD